MLLVGITGPVGSGKTSLLIKLAAWFQQQNKGVEGFIAVGENRSSPNQGADNYKLLLIASGRELVYATRDESKMPPYIFDNMAELELTKWAEQLKLKGTPPLIILDEFGSLEASGKGHTQFWDEIKSSNPQLAVIAVRNGLVPEIEKVLKTQFDVCIDVQTKEAWERLRTICVEHNDWKRVGAYGAAAGSFEASVGAMLHTAQIPFRGIALSSIQSMVMTFAGDGLGTRGKVVWVPFISAGIKALSPTGDRLNPMLAISAQGILFTLATMLLGWNILGVALGGFFVGAWAASQGVILQYLLVGNDIVRVYDFLLRWVAEKLNLPSMGLIGLLLIWSAVAGLCSASVTLYAYKRRHRIPARLQNLLSKGVGKLISEEPVHTWKSAIKLSFRDLARPFFWAPICVVLIFVWISGSSIENFFWILFRASTIAIIIFSLVRLFEPRAFLGWLRKRGYWGPAYAFKLVFLNKTKPIEQDQKV